MDTIDAFKKNQEKTIDVLRKLLSFLEQGKEFGIDIDAKLVDKVKNGITVTKEQKLKVALIGGFSEGKTSIAAAWSEHYDKASMKISQSESSDEIAVYPLGDFDLIDTPGLFGFKETEDKEKYKEITKKYISEAHLVLYVMNPNNPVKESHKEELLWLFKDLNLLGRTVFVLSRFDEEIDIEDEEDYSKGLRIKTENIKGRLCDFGIITKSDNISIVAVSANPFERGIDYWLAHLEEFKKLSHIGLLQDATTSKIATAGNTTELVLATQKTIVNDILRRELPVAEQKVEKIADECRQFQEVYNDIKADMERTTQKVNAALSNLREFVLDFFTDLILQAQGTSMETFNEFFQRNIGDEGIVLETRINNEFTRQLDNTTRDIGKMQLSFEAGVQQYTSTIGEMAFNGLKMGGDFLKSGAINITNAGVLATRNTLNLPIKFKPWGAVKLANGLNKAIPIVGSLIGIGLDLWDSYSKMEKEKKFRQSIDKMVECFEKQRKEYLAFLADENALMKNCYPELTELQNKLNLMGQELANKTEQQRRFNRWKEEGDVIEAEFQIIK